MRATQYLADNGVEKFFKWYDHESWYPLGRPVGTTIYPGMQFTAVAIWNVLKLKEWRTVFGLKIKMSLNDVCVFIPAWFGAIATIVLGLLTREVSGSWRAGAAAAVPARHRAGCGARADRPGGAPRRPAVLCP